MKKNYSQQEIADELRVSRATIDRVIHDRGGIGEETVKRVKEFLAKVDYKPNKVAQGLSKKMKKKICFIYHVPENEFFSEILRGIKSAVNEIGDYGFSIDVKFSNRNSEEQIEIIRQELQNGADAIVLSPFEPDKFVDIVDEVSQKGVPVITFNNDIPDSKRMFFVGTDYYQSGKVAGELLGRIVKKGTIAVLIGEGNDWQVSSRLQGFKDVVGQFPSIRVLERRLFSLPHTESSYRAASELIEQGVDALFPLQAGLRGIVQAKEKMNAGHIDVLSFDLSSSTRLHLEKGLITATICQEPFYQGYYPVKVLFDYFFDHKMPNKSCHNTNLDVIFKENMSNYSNY